VGGEYTSRGRTAPGGFRARDPFGARQGPPDHELLRVESFGKGGLGGIGLSGGESSTQLGAQGQAV
jgi:hypothetical protein